MPAKRIKTLYKEKGHRMHRTHRSKRGSTKPKPGYAQLQIYKKKLAELNEQEQYEDINNGTLRIRGIGDF